MTWYENDKNKRWVGKMQRLWLDLDLKGLRLYCSGKHLGGSLIYKVAGLDEGDVIWVKDKMAGYED